MKIPATVLILTKNEALHIERCVHSAQDFAEVLVVDSSSLDGTADLARTAGSKVVNFDWDGAYPKKKEWALQHASHDWVVYLDADEFLTDKLVREIRVTIAKPEVAAFEVPLSYHWMGRELRHGHKVKKRIGIRREACYWPRPDDLHVKNMWEVEGHYQPQVTVGTVAQLKETLGHQDEDGLYEYFARHNRYSDWEAHMLASNDAESRRTRSRLGRMAVHVPGKPFVFFIYAYLLRRGFLDGAAGFHYALALAFYYWQISIKQHEIERTPLRDVRESDSETGGKL